jgi:hypothetical protein
MNMRSLEVPEYVWEEFRKPLITEFWTINKRERSLQRVYKLAAHALVDFEVGRAQWDINEGQYKSKYCLEPIGFHCVGQLFYVYGENRGVKSAFAIFKSPHSAAEYFVWLVSKDQCSIDWSLFLDMES